MSDRRISLIKSTGASVEKMQPVGRKGPMRATAAQFMPLDQRRGIYRAFHDAGRSVEQIAASSGIGRLLVQDVLRRGRDEEIGRQRQLVVIGRVA